MFFNKAHSSSDCDEVEKLPERRMYFKDHKLCFNCGISGHEARQCVKQACIGCKKKHHTSLYDDSFGVTVKYSPQGETALALVPLKSTTKFTGVL